MEQNDNSTAEPISDSQYQARLLTVLHTLESQLEKQNSLKLTFLRGAVYGFGTVIGASVLVVLFGGILATTINVLVDEPILSETLDVNR